MTAALTNAIYLGFVALLWMPLIVVADPLGSPYGATVGKALYARVVIEMIVGLWVLLLVLGRTQMPTRSWVVRTFGAYVLISLIASVFGVSFTRSIWSEFARMMGVWNLVHWFLLVVVAAAVLRGPLAWHRLLNLNLVVVLFLCVVALAQVYNADLSFFPFLPSAVFPVDTGYRVSATLGNPLYLAATVVTAVFVAIGYLVRSFLPDPGTGPSPGQAEETEPSLAAWTPPGAAWTQPAARVFWLLVIAGSVWVLFLTGTRGGYIGLVAGALTVPLAVRIWGNRQVLWPLSAGMVAVLLAFGGLFLADSLGGAAAPSEAKKNVGAARVAKTSLNEESVEIRLLAAEAGLQAYLDRPLLGWGPENFFVAYDRFADPTRYQLGIVDRGHNQILDEMVTKGTLGALSYVALWAAIVWAIVRRRRPPRDEVLAYAILGSLGAYFAQNMFLFDSAATIFQWGLLVAWVAAQERPAAAAPSGEASGPRTPRLLTVVLRGRRGWHLRAVAIGGMLALLGLSLYYMNYRAFAAQNTFRDSFAVAPLSRQLELAQRSYREAPGLATASRQVHVTWLASRWDTFDLEDKERALQFVVQEGFKAREAEPQSHTLHRNYIVFFQKWQQTPEQMQETD
ncbi:MAG: O-antigen ligase family protein, partial [Chloroflexi bacterium]|nr:O-antigen ligase family protein [Chloroflexota bacterium]